MTALAQAALRSPARAGEREIPPTVSAAELSSARPLETTGAAPGRLRSFSPGRPGVVSGPERHCENLRRRVTGLGDPDRVRGPCGGPSRSRSSVKCCCRGERASSSRRACGRFASYSLSDSVVAAEAVVSSLSAGCFAPRETGLGLRKVSVAKAAAVARFVPDVVVGRGGGERCRGGRVGAADDSA